MDFWKILSLDFEFKKKNDNLSQISFISRREAIIYIKFVKITEREESLFIIDGNTMIITNASVIGCRSLETGEHLAKILKSRYFLPVLATWLYPRRKVNFRSASGRSQNDSGAERGGEGGGLYIIEPFVSWCVLEGCASSRAFA